MLWLSTNQWHNERAKTQTNLYSRCWNFKKSETINHKKTEKLTQVIEQNQLSANGRS
jgi:hypothetical protein